MTGAARVREACAPGHTQDMEREGGRVPKDKLTRAQRALREAAKRLAEGVDTASVAPPSDGSGR